MVYLTCGDAELFNTTSATVLVNLEGSSNHSYSLSALEMTVKPVDPDAKLVGDDAVVGPSAAASTSVAGTLNVDVVCPVAGTVWV